MLKRMTLALCLLLVAGGAQAAITRAGGGNCWAGNTKLSSTSVNVTLPSSVAAGSLLVVFTAAGANETITLSDGTNTYTSSAVSFYQTNLAAKIQIGYAANVASGSTTITASGPGTVNRAIYVCEYIGAATASVVDGTPTSSGHDGSSENPAPGSITSTGAAVFIGAFVIEPTGTETAGSGYTKQVESTAWNGYQLDLQDQIFSSATSNDPGLASPSNYSGRIGIAFKAAPTGSVDQQAFRFYNDDGSESAATAAQTQGTDDTVALDTARIVRFLLQGTDDPDPATFKLKYQKNGSGGYADVLIGASTSPALTWGAAGTIAYSASGGTTVAPTYPTGITTNSALVLVLGMKPSSANGGTVTTPSGWTLQCQITGATDGDTGGYTTTLAADTGNTNLYMYTKDSVTGSESGTLSVTIGTNNVSWANIYRLQSSAVATWSYACATGKDTSAGSVSIATGSMSITAGDHIIGAMVIPTDVTTPAQFSAESFTQSGTTFGTVNEVEEAYSTTGNDIGGFIIESAVSSGSGSGAVTMAATAGGTTTNVRGPGIVLRARASAVTNQIYIATSSNITDTGEDTTNRLTGGTGTFATGRIWDSENGTDSLDITEDDFTEVAWNVKMQSPASSSDYFDLRVYSGDNALDAYTDTPRLTVASGGGSSIVPLLQHHYQQMSAINDEHYDQRVAVNVRK